jgi:hypothetical protein
MRSLVVIFLVTVIMAGCKRKDANTASVTSELTGQSESVLSDSSQFTTIEWKETTIDFGKIKEGQKLEVVFHFKNTGNKPLVITRVVPSCGCTVAERPEEPVAPGKEGFIKGAFDSNGRIGTQHKTIEVGANTKGIQNHQLVFEVEVVKNS